MASGSKEFQARPEDRLLNKPNAVGQNRPANGWPYRLAAYLGIIFSGLLLYLPNLGLRELVDEEGRRAIPAREMLASKNLAIPTIWGEPYLNKPPFYIWEVALTARLRGELDEWSVRFPSLLATVLTALALLFLGGRLEHSRAGLYAALGFLVTLAVFSKGTVGEMEATLALTTLLALGFLWLGRSGSVLFLGLSGLFLAIAFLTKGPPVLVFFGAGLVGLGLSREKDRGYRWAWLPLLVAAIMAGFWVVAVLERVSPERIKALLMQQAIRGHGDNLVIYFKDRRRLIGGILVGFFPASLVLLALARSVLAAAIRHRPHLRFLCWTLVLGLVFFFLIPGGRPRYAYPLLPIACLMAGLILCHGPQNERARRGLAVVVTSIAALGPILMAASIWILWQPFGTFKGFSPWAYFLIVVILGLSAATVASHRRGAHHAAAWMCFCILAGFRLVYTLDVDPQWAKARQYRARAARLEEHIAPSERVYIQLRGHYNLLYYLDRPLLKLHRPGQATPGDLALMDPHTWRQWSRDGGFRGQEIYRLPLDEGEAVLLRVQ